jgi:hypothetical protein
MQRQIRRLRQLAQQPVMLPFQRVWPLALTGQAAGPPVARARCDHFITLATLTRNERHHRSAGLTVGDRDHDALPKIQ